MTWIFLLLTLILIVFQYRNSKRSRKKFISRQKNNHIEFIRNVRENWDELKIRTEDCIIINYNTKENKNSPLYSLTNEDETFYEWVDSDPNKVNLVDVKRSKIICEYKQNGEVLKQFSKTVDIDKTVVEFKVRLKDYISVYTSEGFEEENYFIDLEFLNEEIDLTKFK